MVQNTQTTQMAQITQETQICSKRLKHADGGGADADFHLRVLDGGADAHFIAQYRTF